MNFSLFSPNIIVFFSVLSTCSLTFIVSRIKLKLLPKQLTITVIAGIVLSLLLEGCIHLAYPTDKLPSALWLMIFPFTFSVTMIFAVIKHKLRWLKWQALGTAIFCLPFSLLLINNFYRFYPTSYSVFSIKERDMAKNSQPTTVLFSDVATSRKATTIESSLYNHTDTLKGQVLSISIPGTLSNFKAREGRLYLPAIYSGAGKINLPVIIMMAGYPGLPENWVDTGLAVTMDEFAVLHHGITPIVFMIDNTGSVTNDTECVDSPRGNVETYLTKDVPSYIKAHYEVATDPANWAIGGLSLGGMCSVMLTLRHPDVFHYFMDFGGETGPEIGSKQKTIQQLFKGSEQEWTAHQPLSILKTRKYPGLGGYIVTAKSDGRDLVDGLRTLTQASKDAGIETVYEELGGQHTFGVWQQSYKDALPWVSNRLGTTECLTTCN